MADNFLVLRGIISFSPCPHDRVSTVGVTWGPQAIMFIIINITNRDSVE